MRRRIWAGLVTGLVAGALAAPAVAAYLPARVLLAFQDERITESSGLAASHHHDDVLFTHNDSGGRAELFAIGADGRTVGTLRLRGLVARDWEDIARGPDGTVWVGDIGDNRRVREEVTLHVVREPAQLRDATLVPTTRRLRYPDGAQDAEALLVHPRTGEAWLVTREVTGSARVYAVPASGPGGAVAELRRVADLRLPIPAALGGVTGGDISPDGRRVVLRTYSAAYEWSLDGDLASALTGQPQVIALPEQQQGESVAYTRSGDALLVGTEGERAQVHVLRRAPTRAEPTPLPTSLATSLATSPAERPAPGAARDDFAAPWLVAFAALAASVLAAAAVLGARRRSRT